MPQEKHIPPNTNRAALVGRWKVGALVLGGEASVAVQAMTDTDTANAQETAAQCRALAQTGAELLRVTVNTPRAAQAVPLLRTLLKTWVSTRRWSAIFIITVTNYCLHIPNAPSVG